MGKGKNKHKKNKSNKPKRPLKGRSHRSTARSAGNARSGKPAGKNGRGQKQIAGVLRKTRRGYGFVVPEDGTPDVFVAGRDLGGAMSGDLVRIAVDKTPQNASGSGKGPAGRIVRILKRGRGSFVGRLEEMPDGDFGFVVPIDPKEGEDIFVEGKDFGGARNGDFVQVQLTRRPEGSYSAEGAVRKILARADDPHGSILALLMQRDVPVEFPPEAAATAAALQRQGIREKDLIGRRDLRGETIVTIDGAQSKDFDDAVSCRRLESGNYLLGVHIADVSHYVTEGDPLDLAARERANSHYLLDLVVPMLPHELSDDLCSLRPGEDRLALSCEMEVTPAGELAHYEIFESVIRSKHRLVYGDISDILEWMDAGGEDASAVGATNGIGTSAELAELLEKYEDILPDLRCMAELLKVLEDAAYRRGSLDFDLPEGEFLVDEAGRIKEVGIHERRVANRLIEAFMVLANETVARHFAGTKTPFIYRVHEKPEREKLEQYLNFATSMGLDPDIQLNDVHSGKLLMLLEQSEKLSSGPILRRMLLRSMQKACYEGTCKGHFGLALTYYCHFTSPIRRYADLFIHREIKRALHGELGALERGSRPHYPAGSKGTSEARVPVLSGSGKTRPTPVTETDDRTAGIAEKISVIERSSIELERDVDKMAAARYMQDHIGETYEGIISGMTGNLLFVELANTIEGAVRLESLEDDYYVHDEEHYCVVGLDNGRRFTLGDPVRVQVTAADPATWSVDFHLLD